MSTKRILTLIAAAAFIAVVAFAAQAAFAGTPSNAYQLSAKQALHEQGLAEPYGELTQDAVRISLAERAVRDDLVSVDYWESTQSLISTHAMRLDQLGERYGETP